LFTSFYVVYLYKIFLAITALTYYN